MKKFLSSALLVLFIGISTPSSATTIQAGELTFGINGFLGFEYTYMTKMPMVIDLGGTPTIMPMSDVSLFNLRHFNLLFSIEQEKLRGLINLHSDNLFATNKDQDTFKGEFEIQIAYGEYAFFEALRVRAGNFLRHSAFITISATCCRSFPRLCSPSCMSLHVITANRSCQAPPRCSSAP